MRDAVAGGNTEGPEHRACRERADGESCTASDFNDLWLPSQETVTARYRCFTEEHLAARDARIRDEEVRQLRASAVVEHAIEMSGGSMQVRPTGAQVDDEWPLDSWIKANQRNGGRVHTRTVVVIKDWSEVPR